MPPSIQTWKLLFIESFVVSKFSNNNLCNLAVGVDGSENMIKKAQHKDSIGKYYASSIEKWNTQEKFDVIFSMETLYYLQDINMILQSLHQKKLLNFLRKKLERLKDLTNMDHLHYITNS